MNRKKLAAAALPALLFAIYAVLSLHMGKPQDKQFRDCSLPSPNAGLKNISLPEQSRPEKTAFFIAADFQPELKLLKVRQKIRWTNTDNAPLSEIYLHIYPNAYKSDNTIFAAGQGGIPPESVTSVELDSVKADGQPVRIEFRNTDVYSPADSTVGVVKLTEPLQPGLSVELSAVWHMRVPKALGRMGYASGEEFFFFAQWFLKPGVPRNGKWICSPFFPFAEFYSDFANYEVHITAPKEYLIAATGANTRTVIVDSNRRKHIFKASPVHDFAWSAIKDGVRESVHLGGENSSFRAHIVALRPYREYIPQYKTALAKIAKFCTEKLGGYPYSTFSLVIAPPKSGGIASMEYPSLAVVGHPASMNPYSFELEELVFHEFIHQYFYGAVRNNEGYEGWLDEGLTEYLTSLAFARFGEKKISSFPWFAGFNAKGMELIRIGEIPLVYSLATIPVPFDADALAAYYNFPHTGALSDSSYLLSEPNIYGAVTYGKGKLFFRGLESIIGQTVLLKCLSLYYKQHRFSRVSAGQLFSLLQKHSRKNLDWYFDSYYRRPSFCDYEIERILPQPTAGVRVTIRQNGTANFPCEVALYTSAGTLRQKLNLRARVQTLVFQTRAEVFGAEVDPERKNIYDINFANNSLMLENQYSGIIYLSLRWFFWMQSFLLSFGSLA